MNDPSEPLVAAGTVEEGIANGRQLLADHPELALRQAETLLKLGPDPRVLRLAAAAHRQLGDTKKAEAAEIVAIEAAIPDPRLKAASIAEIEGRSEEASLIAAAYLREQPDDLLAMTISAETAVSARALEPAEKMLRHILSRAPQFVRASMILAKCLLLQSRLPEAVEVVEHILKRKPNDPVALRLHARLLADTRHYDDSAADWERLITLDDREIDLWINYASTLRFMGRRQDAELALRRGLSMTPGHGGCWWQLADLSGGALADRDLTAMQEALAEVGANIIDATNLNFAIGLVFDHRGQHEQAFKHFAAGNAGRVQVQPYDPGDLSAEIDKACTLFTRSYFAGRAAGNRDASPIFIVGMPRSGSTMVERILGRHSKIEACGELPIVPRIAEQLIGEAAGAKRERGAIANISDAKVAELSAAFLDRARPFRHTDKPRFTDKLHMNWRYLGLIRLLLPNARIIDLRRNALDCCWSNYKTQFAQGHPAANDLTHLGRFYRDYVRMMDHMVHVAPANILHVNYEDVVDDVERETRRILDFLGLAFEPQCLDFHLAPDHVATASSEQVRRPLNREGIGASLPYRQWLDPLVEALGRLAAEPPSSSR